MRLSIRQNQQHFSLFSGEQKLLHAPPERGGQRRPSSGSEVDAGMNGLSGFKERIDRTRISPVVSVEGCYGDIEPSDPGTGRCDGMAGCRRQFHAFAVHAGGCVQQDVEACIDSNDFRLLDEDLWVSCLDSEQLCRVEPPSC